MGPLAGRRIRTPHRSAPTRSQQPKGGGALQVEVDAGETRKPEVERGTFRGCFDQELGDRFAAERGLEIEVGAVGDRSFEAFLAVPPREGMRFCGGERGNGGAGRAGRQVRVVVFAAACPELRAPVVKRNWRNSQVSQSFRPPTAPSLRIEAPWNGGSSDC